MAVRKLKPIEERDPYAAAVLNAFDSCEDGGDECERCHGDGRDPWNDYLLPCPLCQGEQQP